MRKAILAAVLVLLVAGAMLARPGAGGSSSLELGREIYEGRGRCWTCHGHGGSGSAKGPDLADGEWQHGNGSYDDVLLVIRAGVGRPKTHPGPMPPMGGAHLTSRELKAVTRYVLSLGQNAQQPAR